MEHTKCPPLFLPLPIPSPQDYAINAVSEPIPTPLPTETTPHPSHSLSSPLLELPPPASPPPVFPAPIPVSFFQYTHPPPSFSFHAEQLLYRLHSIWDLSNLEGGVGGRSAFSCACLLPVLSCYIRRSLDWLYFGEGRSGLGKKVCRMLGALSIFSMLRFREDLDQRKGAPSNVDMMLVFLLLEFLSRHLQSSLANIYWEPLFNNDAI